MHLRLSAALAVSTAAASSIVACVSDDTSENGDASSDASVTDVANADGGGADAVAPRTK
jgi:hypothetical protein